MLSISKIAQQQTEQINSANYSPRSKPLSNEARPFDFDTMTMSQYSTEACSAMNGYRSLEFLDQLLKSAEARRFHPRYFTDKNNRPLLVIALDRDFKKFDPNSESGKLVKDKHYTTLHGIYLNIMLLLEFDVKNNVVDNCMINQADSNGLTPLHIAVQRGNVWAVDLLLKQKNINPFAIDKDKVTPLQYAAGCGFIDILECFKIYSDKSAEARKELEKQLVRKDSRSKVLLHYAASSKRVEVIAWTLCTMSGLDSDWLSTISNFNHYDSFSHSPLYYFVISGGSLLSDLVNKLCTREGTQINNDHSELIYRWILDHICNKSISLQKLIHVTAGKGNLSQIEDILSITNQWPDQIDFINAQDSVKRTAFHYAAERGDKAVLRMLYRHAVSGQLLSKVDNDGNTPLELAENNANLVSAEWLIKKFSTSINKSEIALARAGSKVRILNTASMTSRLSLDFGGMKDDPALYDDEKKLLGVFRDYIKDKDYDQAIHIIRANNAALVNVLDDKGRAPIHIVCRYGALPVLEEILSLDLRQAKRIDDHLWKVQPLHWVAHASGKEYFDIKTAIAMSKLLFQTGKVSVFDTGRNSFDWNALHVAIRFGAKGKELIEYLINTVTKEDDRVRLINGPVSFGWSPLDIAAIAGQNEIAKFLLDNGAKIFEMENGKKVWLKSKRAKSNFEFEGEGISLSDGITCAHIAALNGHAEVLQVFYEYDSSLAVEPDYYGRLPLHFAAWFGQVEAFENIFKNSYQSHIKPGNNLFISGPKDEHGLAPLHYACRPTPDLMERYNFSNEYLHHDGDDWALGIRITDKSNKVKIVERLIGLKADTLVTAEIKGFKNRRWWEHGITPMHFAAMLGDVSLLTVLTNESRSSLDKTSTGKWSILHEAACFGREAALKFLLDEGANPILKNTRHWNPLHLAACKGFFDCSKVLLEKAPELLASIDLDGCTAVHIAALNGHADLLKLYFSIDENSLLQLDNEGRQPIHYAAWHGNLDCVKLLVDLFPEQKLYNAQDKQGSTVLTYACKYPEYVNGRNRAAVKWSTVLAYSAVHNKQDVVSYLLRLPNTRVAILKGADDRVGNTSLGLLLIALQTQSSLPDNIPGGRHLEISIIIVKYLINKLCIIQKPEDNELIDVLLDKRAILFALTHCYDNFLATYLYCLQSSYPYFSKANQTKITDFINSIARSPDLPSVLKNRDSSVLTDEPQIQPLILRLFNNKSQHVIKYFYQYLHHSKLYFPRIYPKINLEEVDSLERNSLHYLALTCFNQTMDDALIKPSETIKDIKWTDAVSQLDYCDQTPVHLAALYNNDKILMELLLSIPHTVGVELLLYPDSFGHTPLYYLLTYHNKPAISDVLHYIYKALENITPNNIRSKIDLKEEINNHLQSLYSDCKTFTMQAERKGRIDVEREFHEIRNILREKIYATREKARSYIIDNAVDINRNPSFKDFTYLASNEQFTKYLLQDLKYFTLGYVQTAQGRINLAFEQQDSGDTTLKLTAEQVSNFSTLTSHIESTNQIVEVNAKVLAYYLWAKCKLSQVEKHYSSGRDIIHDVHVKLREMEELVKVNQEKVHFQLLNEVCLEAQLETRWVENLSSVSLSSTSDRLIGQDAQATNFSIDADKSWLQIYWPEEKSPARTSSVTDLIEINLVSNALKIGTSVSSFSVAHNSKEFTSWKFNDNLLIDGKTNATRAVAIHQEYFTMPPLFTNIVQKANTLFAQQDFVQAREALTQAFEVAHIDDDQIDLSPEECIEPLKHLKLPVFVNSAVLAYSLGILIELKLSSGKRISQTDYKIKDYLSQLKECVSKHRTEEHYVLLVHVYSLLGPELGHSSVSPIARVQKHFREKMLLNWLNEANAKTSAGGDEISLPLFNVMANTYSHKIHVREENGKFIINHFEEPKVTAFQCASKLAEGKYGAFNDDQYKDEKSKQISAERLDLLKDNIANYLKLVKDHLNLVFEQTDRLDRLENLLFNDKVVFANFLIEVSTRIFERLTELNSQIESFPEDQEKLRVISEEIQALGEIQQLNSKLIIKCQKVINPSNTPVSTEFSNMLLSVLERR